MWFTLKQQSHHYICKRRYSSFYFVTNLHFASLNVLHDMFITADEDGEAEHVKTTLVYTGHVCCDVTYAEMSQNCHFSPLPSPPLYISTKLNSFCTPVCSLHTCLCYLCNLVLVIICDTTFKTFKICFKILYLYS